jgi:hypothetical protein
MEIPVTSNESVLTVLLLSAAQTDCHVMKDHREDTS